MPNENIKQLNAESFAETVSADSGTVLVDFWAEWCAPCRAIAPLLAQIADEHAGKVTIAKVNVDESQELAMKYDVQSIPTLIIFQDGEIKEKFIGMTSKKNIEEKLGV